MINWTKEVEDRQESLIKATRELLQIKSVLDEENPTAEAPLGQGVKDALQYMLDLGRKDGFTTKNVGNLAGHLEFGQGDECVGILCHVDVVPEGDGWASDPFGADVRDGKIFARGAIDDKGPTMAAYYAMKIVKELGLPLNRRVRMIIGTDEESNWRCVDHYFEHEEMPTFGFAPDADFPIINAEKGIADFDLIQKISEVKQESNHNCEVSHFQAGLRYNMVPDFAKARLIISENASDYIGKFEQYLAKNELIGKYDQENAEITFEIEGVSAHGMEPDKGKNAGLLLTNFLTSLPLDPQAAKYFTFVKEYFYEDSRGKELDVSYADEITGDLTINVGKLSYTKEAGGQLGLNLRYPVTTDMEAVKAKLEEVAGANSFYLDHFSNSKPHHVAENDFLIQVLKKVYEEQVGEKAELLAIGGGTYARSLQSGVAFGPLFPGRPDVAHQKDEYMIIADLIKATAIYAQAIYELAK